MTDSPRQVVETSAGELEVVFGVNGWVSLSGQAGSSQVQAHSAEQLHRQLASASGIPFEEALEIARRVWSSRPKDAGAPDVSSEESAHRSTGLSGRGVALLFAAVFAVIAIVAADACQELKERDRERDETPSAMSRPAL